MVMSDVEKPEGPIQTGLKAIRQAAARLPETPGVYRMLDEGGEALYVGKAKSLKKRVLSYTNFSRLGNRLQRMVALTRSMEFVHTHTEAEALLLESNLIKKLKPRFNILLRDDKSFPYILLRKDHDFPAVEKHRGAKNRKGDYYGPYASAGHVNRTILALQRAFMLRNCSDTVFANRSRPCLQYHIKRCTAPCVGRVGEDEYAGQVAEAKAFLEGQNSDVKEILARKMQDASAAMEYERAAQLRDRIRALTSIQAHQDINVEGLGDVDVMALAQDGGQTCIQVFFFRAGRNHGNRAYYPVHDKEDKPASIMAAFITQFYENKPVPPSVFVSVSPTDRELLEEAFSEKAGRKIEIRRPSRGKGRRILDFVATNAENALRRHLAERQSEARFLKALAEMLDLDAPPARIEIYDNSHISGTHMVGALVAAGPEGFIKSAYRKFNIKKAGEADDTAMMREVLERRFKRALRDEDGRSGPGSEVWPDVVMIDGGKGQLNAALSVLEELGIADQLTLISIAKGPQRNAGREQFFIPGKDPFRLPPNDPVLFYLQRLRDEAHRFAIGTHRARRQKQISASPLDQIKGIGAKRKKALLNYFGSAKAVGAAGVEDLQKVKGISAAMAQHIYDHFHS